MKAIKLCAECADYDRKKHRCKRGASCEDNAQNPFYDDCPLPGAVVSTSREFGDMMVCAVRYALGRRSYIVAEVARFVSLLSPELHSSSLAVICTDIYEADIRGNLGDETIDAPVWRNLYRTCAEELQKRGGNT